jgi:hypothetical protein
MFIISLIKRLKRKMKNRKEDELTCLGKLIKYSNEIIIELYAIIICNSFFNICFAAFLPLIDFLGIFNDEKDNIYGPILLRKFFIF